MSGRPRKHFWTVVTRGRRRLLEPRKYGFSGCIPADVKSVEGSSAAGPARPRAAGGGPSLEEGEESLAQLRRRSVHRAGLSVRALTPRRADRRRSPGRASSGSSVACAAPTAGGSVLVRRDLVADLLERAADQARDVHLRDPDLLGDLRLRQPLEEAQVEDRAARGRRATRNPGASTARSSRHLVLVLDLAERLERVEVVVVAAARRPARERQRRVRAARSRAPRAPPPPRRRPPWRARGSSASGRAARSAARSGCDSWTFSSWRPRGTRTDQPLSRKWRLISPMMFGVA